MQATHPVIISNFQVRVAMVELGLHTSLRTVRARNHTLLPWLPGFLDIEWLVVDI